MKCLMCLVDSTQRGPFLGGWLDSVLALLKCVVWAMRVFWISGNQTMHGSTGGLYSIRCFDIFDLRFIITGNKIEVFTGFCLGKKSTNIERLRFGGMFWCLHVFCLLSKADMIMHHAAHGPKIQEGLWTCCGLGKRRIQWNYVQQSSRRSCDLIMFIYIYI